MAYHNALYRAVQQHLPCASCEQRTGGLEFYRVDKTVDPVRWYWVSAYPTQAVMDTAERLAGLLPLCGPCFRAGGDFHLLPVITRARLAEIPVRLYRRPAVRFGDYAKVITGG